MRTLEIALHGVSLTCCVGLGAALWTVSQRPPQAVPALPPPAADTSARLEPELRRLRSELESVRLELSQLREDAPAPRAQLAPVPPVSAGSLEAALDDPKVREKLKAVVEAQLDAERKSEDRQREERWQSAGSRWTGQRLEEFAKRLELNDTQKEGLGKILEEARGQFDRLRGQVRDKSLTPEEARSALDRAYAELDAKAQGLMTAEQYKQYQEISKPMRDMASRFAFQEGPGGMRTYGRERERPTP